MSQDAYKKKISACSLIVTLMKNTVGESEVCLVLLLFFFFFCLSFIVEKATLMSVRAVPLITIK